MTLNFNVNKSPEFVFDCLTDIQKFVSVHPVIYKAEKQSDGNYKIYERLRLLFIPFSFVYNASIEGDKTGRCVTMKARVMGLVNITMIYSLQEINGLTSVTELVNFNTFLPVKTLLTKIFNTQHKQLFLNINNLNQ